jgi:hypothetical protein
MNKRSAVFIAGGLVLLMAVGGLAVSLGLTGPTPVNAAGPVRPERVVKVERKTVTVHRKAKPAAGSAIQVFATSPGSITTDDAAAEHEDEQELQDREDLEEVEEPEAEVD